MQSCTYQQCSLGQGISLLTALVLNLKNGDNKKKIKVVSSGEGDLVKVMSNSLHSAGDFVNVPYKW